MTGTLSPAQTATQASMSSGTRSLLPILANLAVPIGFVVMVVTFGILRPDTFLTLSTVTDVLNQAAIPVILACGVTFTMTVGQFDLSFTGLFGFSGAVVIVAMSENGWPGVLAGVVALLLALAVGTVIGLLVTLGRASSFIVTLALGSVLIGLETMVSGNKNIYQNIPTSFTDLATVKILGLNLPVWIAIIVCLVSFVTMHATGFGRHAYAIGGNDKAAFLAGVRVRRVRVLAFVVLGATACIGAVIATSKASSYYPNIAGGYLLSTYAAVFLGAAMSRSNRFTVGGSALGVVWLLSLQTGLTQLNQPAWVSTLLQGLVLASAVLIAAGKGGGKK
ncbi:ABC transporter permease [Rhodococcoides kyotonense]|uniref:Ribose transport system permease protein n=1 Tax=Rhodococcoides kyotonense TaxID=398843 RepID=A0A239K459_9NOCA|nr:ABC transporter permease [Rhodococcus kyotonensis]SNT12462.1 ribose transport system permease protein [Rhodococcus kyotonensis]